MTTAVFLGTPEAALPALRALADFAEVRAVVTRPARERGRGRKTQPTPVADAAEGMGLAVHIKAVRMVLVKFGNRADTIGGQKFVFIQHGL